MWTSRGGEEVGEASEVLGRDMRRKREADWPCGQWQGRQLAIVDEVVLDVGAISMDFVWM